MKTIDLNCDVGEGFDSNEALIMPLISSVNIACGYHAGTEESINRTIALAMQHGLTIGAHPSYNDQENFGRKPMQLADNQYFELISEQVIYLKNLVENQGGKLRHVKLHGALYNQTAADVNLALIAAEAVYKVDASLVFMGLAGSQHLVAAKKLGLRAVSEVFSDRSYQANGSLTPRTEHGASLTDAEQVVKHVLGMVENQQVFSIEGKLISVVAETICIHGDGPNAVLFATKINEALVSKGIKIGFE